MHKPYSSLSELVSNCEANLDYRVQITDRGAAASIISIHGGAIEPLTSELTAAIACEDYNRYDLSGLRIIDNKTLRIPVNRFDDVRLYTLLKRSQIALAVDGVPGAVPVVHLGGGNPLLKQIINDQLIRSGFQVKPPYTAGAAHDPARFYNAATTGGVLLELSETLRAKMTSEQLAGNGWQQSASWQGSFFEFSVAIRMALQTYLNQANSDLESAIARFEEITRRIPQRILPQKHNKQ
jgi:phage replication-related protein YjqB (UPF0714/DUF867 family)